MTKRLETMKTKTKIKTVSIPLSKVERPKIRYPEILRVQIRLDSPEMREAIKDCAELIVNGRRFVPQTVCDLISPDSGSRKKALETVSCFRDVQDKQHGANHTHSPAEWLLIIERQLEKAKEAWRKTGDLAALERIAHIGACAVACLEQNVP